MLIKTQSRYSGDSLKIIQYSSMLDPRFKRKKYNVDENLEQDLITLAITLNQSDQNLQSQSQIGPTEGQEYPNLSVISNMPSTSTSLQNLGSKRIVNIFDSQDDVDIDCPDESLEEIIKLEYSHYKKMVS